MLQTCKTVQEFLLQPRREERIARIGALTPQRGNCQLGKLTRFCQVFGAPFIVNGQLFAGLNAVVRIGNSFLPDLCCAPMFTAGLEHKRKFAPRFRAEFLRQTQFQRLHTREMRAIVLPAPVQESGESEEVEAFDFVCGAGCVRKQRVDFAEESSEPAQIHLIVPNDSGERLGRPATEVVEIKLRYERGSNVVLAMPAEARRVEDAAFKFHEPPRTEPKLPKPSAGLRLVKMCPPL